MMKYQRSILIKCIVFSIAIAGFLILGFANSRSSDNVAMVQIFEPDEAAQIPYLMDMLKQSSSMEQSIRNIIFYKYYTYGFPYFALSAITVLPLKWLGQLGNTPFVFLVLRQIISVLPILAGLLLIVYMHDQFQTYRSPLLLVILLIIPAVLHNALWWHPDGLVLFLSVLVLFFLWKDNGQIKRYFYFAAIACGLLTATKIIGVFYFFTIAFVLIKSLVKKTNNWKRLILSAFLFILIMAAIFVFSNPFLLSHWARLDYARMISQQLEVISQGFNVVYQKGLIASLPLMTEYYGSFLFLLFVLFSCFWGILRGKQKYLFAMTFCWFVPLTVYLLTCSHFKYHYWLPVAIPFISSISIWLPEKMIIDKKHLKKTLIPFIPISALLLQCSFFIIQDVHAYSLKMNQAENDPHILFYDEMQNELAPLQEKVISVYYDYHMYLPQHTGWVQTTSYGLLDYDFINENGFDVLVLERQRIDDYLNPSVTGIDPTAFALCQDFYRNAQTGTIDGFRLLFENETGLLFVSEDMYQVHFPK